MAVCARRRHGLRRDRAAGLSTGCFISGYRGSPLGGYDQQLVKARKHLDRHGVVFQPGLNEDLAATAVWGSTFVVTKGSLQDLAPAAFLVWRFGIAAVILMAARPARVRARFQARYRLS